MEEPERVVTFPVSVCSCERHFGALIDGSVRNIRCEQGEVGIGDLVVLERRGKKWYLYRGDK